MNNTEVLNGNMNNSKAVASLILGALSVVIPSFAFAILGIVSTAMPIIVLASSVIGIYLSKKAKKEIYETSQDGKILAVCGFYSSIAAILVQILIALELLYVYFIR